MYIVLLLFLFVYLSSNWQQSVQDLKQWQGMAAFSFYRYTVYLYCIYTSVFFRYLRSYAGTVSPRPLPPLDTQEGSVLKVVTTDFISFGTET